MSEEYSVGYEEGYQAGWNAAIDAYTAPQPVKEVELTDADVEALFWKWKSTTEYPVPLFEFRDIARAVIAAYKEKNQWNS